ncbi:hypothetical protein HY620_02000, partial [Candidatus Uhrbacteria bacterium]|nr:hypothetical protein [Candidatus Uhrbacteria bacterium]
MSNIFQKLPQDIQDVLLSDEYDLFLADIKNRFRLVDEQMKKVEDTIFGLFEKKYAPLDLDELIKEQFQLNEKDRKMMVRLLVLNIVLVFPAYFGDYSEMYTALGGDLERDAQESMTYLALMKIMNASIRSVAKKIDAVDWEKEAKEMLEFFESKIADHLYTDDGPYKISLNSMLLAVLANKDNFSEELLKHLYLNKQHIGSIKIGGAEPTVANWITDFLDFAGGEVTSIAIAKYLGTSPHVCALPEQDREALHKLLQTFEVLKNFPASLEKLDPMQWMVIPYKLPEAQLGKSPISNTQFPINSQNQNIQVANEQKAVISNTVRDPGQEAGLPQSLSLLRNDKKDKTLQTTNYKLQTAKAIALAMGNDYDKAAADVMKKSSVVIPTGLELRIQKILVTRLRNVRNTTETKEKLIAPATGSGAGLTEAEADTLLKDLQQVFDALHKSEELRSTPARGGSASGGNQESGLE